jgi:hypothetical protein
LTTIIVRSVKEGRPLSCLLGRDIGDLLCVLTYGGHQYLLLHYFFDRGNGSSEAREALWRPQSFAPLSGIASGKDICPVCFFRFALPTLCSPAIHAW